MSFSGRIGTNLALRLKLLRIAFFRRYVWPDVRAMALARDFREITGDIEPLGFSRAVFKSNGLPIPEPPDFSKIPFSAELFTPARAPESANSEPNVGRFLGQLVFYKKPAVVVELGCLGGWTSTHIAMALQANGKGQLYCVDCEQHHLDLASSNLKRLGFEKCSKMLTGTSVDPKVLAALPKVIDIVFLDTSHRYPETVEEIKLYSSRLAEDGCIVMHDAVSHANVRRSIAEVARNFRILTFATERGDGISVLLKASAVPPV